ncbi:HES5 factor, partial [Calyptomena viridis]|nr:HES5 factor [Calyptomena viridis]
ESQRCERIYCSLEQLKLLPEKGFQRHQPSPELEKGNPPGMAVSYPKYRRAFAAPAKSTCQDRHGRYTQCLRAALQFLAPCSTITDTGMKLSCPFQRSRAAPEDSGCPSAAASTHQPPAKPAAPNPSRCLRRPW